MALRRDALLVASDLVRKVNDIACAHPPHGRGTVGWVDVHPNSRNVIPGRVTLTVDLRAADDATLATMDAELRAPTRAAAGMPIDVEQVVYFPPQPFDATLVEQVRAGARALGLSSMNVISGRATTPCISRAWRRPR